MKTGHEIREDFLSFFEERAHRRVKSSSLVPKDDPSLLFTNAGMNQFKDFFLGLEQRNYRRAASSQKCMRVSGKHNDLETVGRTPRHHTFFEMLGNFSFGDYFKKEAIEFAWELCTEVFQVDRQRLVVTVFEEDDEALQLWRDHIGVSSQRIFRCGEKDNFWSMGETGPCGPCSELHYDMGERVGDTHSPFGHDGDRYVEIWNLVFMQFNRDASGTTQPLPSPSIDTGMGLERITSVLQGVASNFETDLFKPLVEEAGRLTHCSYGDSEEVDVSLRILADHSRACMFLIDDGVVPANEGRGYVLRKILRRAIRHGNMLGQEQPFIFTLTSLVAELMGDAYPELLHSREYAAKIVRSEEEKFSATLHHGMSLLEEVFEELGKKDEKVVAGADLFRLYDTFGFPPDLAREIAAERGYSIDQRGFDTELEKQRQRARASWKGGEKVVKPIYAKLASRGHDTEFLGYTEIDNVPATVLALLDNDSLTSTLGEGQTAQVVLDRTPFYAEAGGQVADRGTIFNDLMQGEVVDVQSPLSGLRLHFVQIKKGSLSVGDRVQASVWRNLRSETANNHTATHLMHAALRLVLGPHVKQAGSLVAPDRMRFDFTHYQPLSATEIREIEEIVNKRIQENIRVRTSIQDLDEAISRGAMALFGEKYDEQVRVVEISDFSTELCGGTHVDRTGDIALFKVVHEGSISAGVRRVEALTGPRAVSRFLQTEALLERTVATLNSTREELDQSLARLQQDLKQAQKEIEALQLQLAHRQSQDSADEARLVGGVQVFSRKVDNVDRTALRQLAAQIRNRLRSGVVVLGTPSEGKVNLVVMVTDDLTERVRANDLIGQIAPLVGGGGGGKADLAEAGGGDASALDHALEQSYGFVEEALTARPG